MKKVFTIFSLFVFLFSTSGYFILFKFAQFKIRQEVKMTIRQKLPENLFTVISFNFDKNSKSALSLKKEKEFWYKGKLYDVVRSKIKGSCIYYYCLNDKQEENLFSNLKEEIKNSSEQQNASKNLSKIINLKSELIYFYRGVLKIPDPGFRKITFHELFSFYKSFVISPNTPPPELLINS